MTSHSPSLRALKLPFAAVVILGLAGCSGLSDTEQRVLSGGAIGATVGTVGTVLTGGCVACGAAIGGAAGAATGFVVDQIEKSDR